MQVTRTRFVFLLMLWSLLALPAMVLAQAQTAKVSAGLVGEGTARTLEVVLDVPAGLHAQSRTPHDPNLIRLDVTLDAPPTGVTFGEPVYPPGVDKTYPALGVLNVYEGRVTVRVPVMFAPNAAQDVSLSGRVRYQLCDDQTCFLPKNAKFQTPGAAPASTDASTTNASPAVAPQVTEIAAPGATTVPTTLSTDDAQASDDPAAFIDADEDDPKSWSILFAFGAALLAGLLFNIMPCVLPVLPLKAMGFYEVAQHKRLQSLLYGVAFSVGVIAIFGVLALLVVVLRWVSWGGLFSHGWFVWTIVGILVVMAVGLFGVFTVNLPTSVYNVAPRHDTYIGNIQWGGLTAILATPCTAPLLPGLLIWALAQPTFMGVSAMLMVGVGMSIPYLILSAFPELARRFPRTGPWPELFKQMMGFMVLGAAVYFGAGRLIQGPGFFWAVCAVAAVASVYLMARTVQLSKNATPVVVSSILAVATLGTTLWWSAKVNGLLSGPSSSSGAMTQSTNWTPYSDEAFTTARASGRPLLVKFTANWCATCQYVEGTVFKDPTALDALSAANFQLMKVDLSDSGAPGEDLLLKLNPAGGIPLTAIYLPGRDRPKVLSAVYTTQTLINAIGKPVEATAWRN